MNYKTKVKDKLLIISKSRDISLLRPGIKSVHFRKYVSKKMIDQILKKCLLLKKLSFSQYSYSRFKDIRKDIDIPDHIRIVVSQGRGRHSLLDRMLLIY